MTEIFIADDEPHLRTATAQALELAGFKVREFPSAEGVLELLSCAWNGVIVSDIKMPGLSGLDLLSRAQDIDKEIPVILITGHGDVPMAVEAMRSGAYDFLTKPFATEILTDAVRRGAEKRRLVLENRSLRAELVSGTGLEQVLVGRTPGMARLREQILSFAAADADVLVQGETGTGKEVVARALHEQGPRKAGRFVPLNCGALPASVIESELFGHEPGAFTGAAKARIGKLEYAGGGTLFLDEIESMPMELQIKLLRVLQDRVVVRLGANEERRIDVRVVAATKEDLRHAAARNTFRADLFYRLNVLVLNIPPLRERRDDIPLLFQRFAYQAAARFKREAPMLEPHELAAAMAYDWPGNVRELQNVALRYAMGLGLDIPGAPSLAMGVAGSGATLADQLAAVERQIIATVLRQNGGSLKATYEALGVSRKTLYDKMRKLGLGKLAPEDDGDEV